MAAQTDVAAPSGTDFHLTSCPDGIDATRVARLSSVRWRPSSVPIEPVHGKRHAHTAVGETVIETDHRKRDIAVFVRP